MKFYQSRIRRRLVYGLAFLSLLLAGCSNPASSSSYGNSGMSSASNQTSSVTYKNTTPDTTGSVPIDSKTYSVGDTVTVLGNTGPLVWSGFSFIGWDTQDNGGIDGGGGGTFYAPGATFTFSSNVTLYGTWK